SLRRLVAAKVRRYCGEHPGVFDGAAGSGQLEQYIEPSDFRAVEIQAEACKALLQNYPAAKVYNTSLFLYTDGEPQDCTVMNPPFSIKLKDLSEDEKKPYRTGIPVEEIGRSR
ncbi:SAM-dependent methyltransferase, partial [Neisseria gonorrhoeae]